MRTLSQDLENVMMTRTFDVTVTQSGGDRTCSLPRAVLYLSEEEDGDIDRALLNLESQPAQEIVLALSSDSATSPKVCRSQRRKFLRLVL